MVSSSPALGSTPFKGLMPYSEEDAAWFFGRDAERELVIANLHSARLTLFYGMSGAGKSSVLRAGVIHKLREELMADRGRGSPPECLVVSFRSWIGDVGKRLGEEIRLRTTEVTGRPSQTAASLVEQCAQATREAECKLLLVLDQFEEYFLYHPDDDGFDDALARVVNHPDLDTNVLISLREDSLSRLDRFKGKIPTLFGNYLRIKHLDRASAQAAIQEPVALFNRLRPQDAVELDPVLIQQVLDAVTIGKLQVGDAGRGAVDSKTHRIEAPYLQLVMTRLWRDSAQRRRLSAEDLGRLGGAGSIVQTHLLEVMQGLPAEQQALAAEAFHYLVTPSGSKIAYTAADLAALTCKAASDVSALLTAFTSGERRILRIAEAAEGGAPRYEIFHDVLGRAILEWRRRYLEAIERAERERQGEQRARAQTRALLKRALYIVIATALVAVALWAWYDGRQQAAQVERERQRARYSEAAQSEATQSAAAAERARAAAEQVYRETLDKQDELIAKLEACTEAGLDSERLTSLRSELEAMRRKAQEAQERAEKLERRAQAAALIELSASSKQAIDVNQMLKQQKSSDDTGKLNEQRARALREEVKKIQADLPAPY